MTNNEKLFIERTRILMKLVTELTENIDKLDMKDIEKITESLIRLAKGGAYLQDVIQIVSGLSKERATKLMNEVQAETLDQTPEEYKEGFEEFEKNFFENKGCLCGKCNKDKDKEKMN